MKNPFSPNTTSHKDFNTLSDLQWHCTKCELKSAQAKTWQVWRQQGLQLATDEKGKYFKKIHCSNCSMQTVHRKLLSLELVDDTKVRSSIPVILIKRIKSLYKYEEAILLRTLQANELEIDHRFPQIRWGQNEEINNINMTDSEIKDKFMLLNRSNNLLKSRYCERCVKTGKRGHFPGIYYWYVGNENWDKNISPNHEVGCEGCFWYNPAKWREELNRLIKQSGIKRSPSENE